MREGMLTGVWAIRGTELLRYGLSSLIALAVDMGLLLALARIAHYLAAATLSFLAGVLVIYLLSTRFVFSRRKLATRQGWEWALFLLIGLAGLVVNNLTIYLAVETFALELALAKLLAAAFTFLFNFSVRKALLF